MYELAAESAKYDHFRLILYLPWHSETELLGNYQTYRHHYNKVRDIIDNNARQFN